MAKGKRKAQDEKEDAYQTTGQDTDTPYDVPNDPILQVSVTVCQ
jgi:hypothetical protein